MKILHVISSPRGEASYSIKLGNAIIDQIKAKYPDSTVKEVNLVKRQFPHLEEAHLTAFFTPAEARTPANEEAIKYSDETIQDVMETDILVIGAPLYNFGVHSSLKAWIDHLARAGVTFRYTENGPEGLVKNKKVYIALASGGVYSEGPMQSYDFVAPYLKTVLGFLGMTDVHIFRVEGSAIPELAGQALERGIKNIQLN